MTTLSTLDHRGAAGARWRRAPGTQFSVPRQLPAGVVHRVAVSRSGQPAGGRRQHRRRPGEPSLGRADDRSACALRPHQTPGTAAARRHPAARGDARGVRRLGCAVVLSGCGRAPACARHLQRLSRLATGAIALRARTLCPPIGGRSHHHSRGVLFRRGVYCRSSRFIRQPTLPNPALRATGAASSPTKTAPAPAWCC